MTDEERKEKNREYAKRYREAHKEEVLEYNRKWRKEHPEKNREYAKRYREDNNEKVNEKKRKYREKHKEKYASYSRKWREKNSEKVKTSKKAYYKKHFKTDRERNKEWVRNNYERFKELCSRYRGNPYEAPNRGAYWPVKDIKLILERSMPDKELSKILGRSIGAIQSMRCKMKKREGEGVILMEEKGGLR